MRSANRFVLGAAIIAIVAVLTTCFVIVDASEQVVVTEFGKPTAVHTQAGIYFKLPVPIQRVTRLDKRLLYTTTGENELLTSDKKNIIVSAYLSWKIADALGYLSALRTRVAAENRLRALVQSELGSALGDVPFSSLVSSDPNISGLKALTNGVEDRCHTIAARDFGIDITDLGITRLNFPSQNLQSVFGRMRAERAQIARGYRSEGKAEAQRIRAEADRKSAELLAAADSKATKLRGDGEAEAAKIYADAYKGHERFYRFLRTLETYDKILGKQTTLILPSDTPLFDLLTSGKASKNPPPLPKPR